MSVQTNNPSIAITAGEALAAYRLIQQDGTYADGDSTVDHIGVNQFAQASGEEASVRLLTAGTCKMTAAEAITAGATVYKAADGKVGLTGANAVVGIAMEAASGDGSIIEVCPIR